MDENIIDWIVYEIICLKNSAQNTPSINHQHLENIRFTGLRRDVLYEKSRKEKLIEEIHNKEKFYRDICELKKKILFSQSPITELKKTIEELRKNINVI